MSTDLRDAIFFEKQESRLCAQHALNMLLQGPYFSADVLAEIGHELDEQEKQVLNAEGRANFKSQNLDDSGFFSVQVITIALKRSWDLDLIPIRSPDLAEFQAAPETAKAYICNLQEHWFVLRRFYRQWYILNSVLDGPKPISDIHLDIYLQQLHSEGYSIHYVDGVLPECEADQVAQEKFALEESMKGREPQPSAPSVNEIDEDDQLDLAIALSLSEAANASDRVQETSGESSNAAELASTSTNQPTPSTSKAKTEAELLRERREKFLKQFENNE